MGKYSAIILSGPSGSGKTVLSNKLISEHPRYKKIVTTTTRPMRPGEVDGKDYNFITRNEFEREISRGEFVEWALVHDQDYYGSKWADLTNAIESKLVPLYVIDVCGAMTMREKLGAKLLPFLIWLEVPGLPNTGELEKRLTARGDTPESIARRMASVNFELSKKREFDYVLENDVFDETHTHLVELLSEKFDKDKV